MFDGKKDNILMWSHYADAHKGICLEFNKDMIDRYKWFIDKVDYPKDNHYIEFKRFLEAIESPEEALRLFLLRKSWNWEYEKEWRIILDSTTIDNNSIDDEDKRFFTCREKMLTGIIFGMKTSDTFRQTITKLAQGKSIQLYEAKRNENSYAIDVIPL